MFDFFADLRTYKSSDLMNCVTERTFHGDAHLLPPKICLTRGLRVDFVPLF